MFHFRRFAGRSSLRNRGLSPRFQRFQTAVRECVSRRRKKPPRKRPFRDLATNLGICNRNHNPTLSLPKPGRLRHRRHRRRHPRPSVGHPRRRRGEIRTCKEPGRATTISAFRCNVRRTSVPDRRLQMKRLLKDKRNWKDKQRTTARNSLQRMPKQS